jgi:DNA modification methylase
LRLKLIMNKLLLGDNLEILKTLESESVDLIYLAPPFFSNIYSQNHSLYNYTNTIMIPCVILMRLNLKAGSFNNTAVFLIYQN